MFCTLMVISCIVLVTSSIAEAALRLILADSSEAPATWLDPLATCAALSRTLLTSVRRPSTILTKALPRVSRGDRGRTSTAKSPPAIDSETAAISRK